MELETERLIVRSFKKTDGGDLYEYLSDPEVIKYEPHLPFTRDAAYGEAERRAGDGHFLAVELKETGKVIGNIYFAEGEFETWEIGYVFNKDYWGKGYAFESAKAVIKNGFLNLGVRKVVAMCNPKNPNSWHLLERLGLRREGTLLQNAYFFKDENGEPLWFDTYEYGMLKSEFKA